MRVGIACCREPSAHQATYVGAATRDRSGLMLTVALAAIV
jgi:hypothetical protein